MHKYLQCLDLLVSPPSAPTFTTSSNGYILVSSSVNYTGAYNVSVLQYILLEISSNGTLLSSLNFSIR